MKPKRTLSAYVLLIGIMGLAIVGGVVIFQIYSALTKSQLTPEQQASIKPLEGQLNPTVIENLGKRRVFSEAELNTRIQIAVSPTQSPVVPTPTQASVSAAIIK